MEKYIYTKRYSICHELCDEIIDRHRNVEIVNDVKIINTIHEELEDALKSIQTICKDSKIEEYILLNNYQFLKLPQNQSGISYSYDLKVIDKNIYSYFDFIIFLNTIEHGGEVEIMDQPKIHAEKGTLLIFPSGWCFPYSHKTPLSSDQYLIKGKLFKKF